MQTKPGWKTTEFWTHILFGVLIAGLTAVTDMTDALPPMGKVVVTAIAPLVLTWLQQQYAAGRTKLKQAAIDAGTEAGVAAAGDTKTTGLNA